MLYHGQKSKTIQICFEQGQRDSYVKQFMSEKTPNYFYTFDKSECTLRIDYFFTACFILLFKYD